jgi:uncharacterized protein (DUF1810 family)
MFDLERFVTAQEPVYEDVLAELRAGRKRTHWMWYIFPQLCGLGRSAMAERFGIVSAEEARAYLAHPLLGKRLVRSVETVLAVPDRSLQEIFRSPDDMKFRSSMTLFCRRRSRGTYFPNRTAAVLFRSRGSCNPSPSPF